jgi:hypothetical protein
MPSAKSTKKKSATDAHAVLDCVAETLEEYARRGVFRGFSRGPTAGGKSQFQISWHRGRVFELTLDANAGALRLPELLTDVAADCPMYQEFKAFVRSRQSDDLPEHRRIDRQKVEIRAYNRDNNILLTLKAKDGDIEYGVRKLVHLVNEIYLVFLADGNYFDYLVETFNLDPDRM